ncbi:MAG: tripartite tricarboxylate transporter substrate-binding protein, partial [Burkholderiales bacterium]
MPKFATALMLAALMAGTPAQAQDYPTKPLRIMIGFAAGGSADLVSRILADRLSQRLGQPVIAENRIGASGVIANEAVVRAA